jgi:hypothetical protein
MLSSTLPTQSVCPTTHSFRFGSLFKSLATSSIAGLDSGFTTALPVSKKMPYIATWPVARRSFAIAAASATTCCFMAPFSTTRIQIFPLPRSISAHTSRPSMTTLPFTQLLGMVAAMVPPIFTRAFS